MARSRVQAIIRDEAGNKLGGTGYEVRFYQRGTNTLATLFPDDVSASTLPNPHYPNAGVQTTLATQTLATDTSITVGSTSGWQQGDFIVLDDGTNRVLLVVLTASGSGITLNAQVGFVFTTALTRVGGREMLGHVASHVDTSTDIEMTVKSLATGIEGPRELYIVKPPTSDYVKQADPTTMPLTGAVASVTFANIPQTARNIHIRWSARANNAVLAQDIKVQLGTGGGAVDTGANYDYETAEASAATWAFVETFAATQGRVGILTGTTAAAGLAGSGEFTIENYTDTHFQKECTGRSGAKLGTATTNLRSSTDRVWWRNTGAVTSIKLFPQAGSFDVGSAFYAYVD